MKRSLKLRGDFEFGICSTASKGIKRSRREHAERGKERDTTEPRLPEQGHAFMDNFDSVKFSRHSLVHHNCIALAPQPSKSDEPSESGSSEVLNEQPHISVPPSLAVGVQSPYPRRKIYREKIKGLTNQLVELVVYYESLLSKAKSLPQEKAKREEDRRSRPNEQSSLQSLEDKRDEMSGSPKDESSGAWPHSLPQTVAEAEEETCRVSSLIAHENAEAIEKLSRDLKAVHVARETEGRMGPEVEVSDGTDEEEAVGGKESSPQCEGEKTGGCISSSSLIVNGGSKKGFEKDTLSRKTSTASLDQALPHRLSPNASDDMQQLLQESSPENDEQEVIGSYPVTGELGIMEASSYLDVANGGALVQDDHFSVASFGSNVKSKKAIAEEDVPKRESLTSKTESWPCEAEDTLHEEFAEMGARSTKFYKQGAADYAEVTSEMNLCRRTDEWKAAVNEKEDLMDEEASTDSFSVVGNFAKEILKQRIFQEKDRNKKRWEKAAKAEVPMSPERVEAQAEEEESEVEDMVDQEAEDHQHAAPDITEEDFFSEEEKETKEDEAYEDEQYTEDEEEDETMPMEDEPEPLEEEESTPHCMQEGDGEAEEGGAKRKLHPGELQKQLLAEIDFQHHLHETELALANMQRNQQLAVKDQELRTVLSLNEQEEELRQQEELLMAQSEQVLYKYFLVPMNASRTLLNFTKLS